MTKYAKRDSFATRLENSDNVTKLYFKELEDYIVSFPKIKGRVSLRCVTYRYNKKEVAKLALGGRSLKLFLAMDPNTDLLIDKKYHPRDLSQTKAYEAVPTMLPIKSELAVRKAKDAIQYMFKDMIDIKDYIEQLNERYKNNNAK